MDGRTVRRRGTALAVAALAAALVLTGCSAGDSGAKDTAGSAAEAPAAANGGEAGRDAAKGGTQEAAGAGAPDLRVDQRAIIYTGTMRVQVDDVDAAARETVAVATRAGGFVGGDQRRSADEDAVAELQLRVPAPRFAGVVEEISKLGRQQSREIDTQDVTEETVDLDARITTQRARVDSARRLLSRASTITDLVTLENELGRREADLASLEAKKRRLADLTALSTITVSLAGPATKKATEKEAETGFLVGLKGGWKAFVASLTVLLTVLGALVPWLALGVPVVVLLLLLRRRKRTSAPTAPVSAPPPVPAARSAP